MKAKTVGEGAFPGRDGKQRKRGRRNVAETEQLTDSEFISAMCDKDKWEYHFLLDARKRLNEDEKLMDATLDALWEAHIDPVIIGKKMDEAEHRKEWWKWGLNET